MVPILKKITFYLFIGISLVAAAWGYFRLKDNKAPTATVTAHIPANAFCIIETKELNQLIPQLTRQNLIWNALLVNESIQSAQKGISYLDSLMKANPEVESVIDGNKIYWSFIRDHSSYQSLIQFKAKERNDEKLFTQFFERVFSKEVSISSFSAYTFTINKQKWLACYKDGIIYFTSDLSLLETAVNLVIQESISSKTSYVALLKENGSQGTEIYINHANYNVFDKTVFTKESIFSTEVKLNEITWNGYTISDTSSFIYTLKNQNASGIRSFETLPDNPVSIHGIAISQGKTFYNQWLQFKPLKLKEDHDAAWRALNDSALYNIKDECLENIESEMVMGEYILDNFNSQIMFIKVKDAEKAEQFLKFSKDSVSRIQDLNVYSIRQNSQLLFSVFNASKAFKYACVNGSFLVLFSDMTMASLYLGSLENKNVLGKNVAFMAYANDNFLQDCNYLYYENTEQIKHYNYPSMINNAELIYTEKALSSISLTAKNYKNSVIQVRLNATNAVHKVDSTGKSNGLWSFESDSVITSDIALFTNHITHDNELCFQDQSNQFYLISSTGNLIWKKKLIEPVQSDIYTVDIFKNGKLQILFNSENYLHLIDRNGNYVQGYPVKLPSKITSNISLFDYDNKKDYRLLIACADRKIYNYSLYGIKTEGFIPFRTDAVVELPVYYTKVGPSDYLVTADINGKLYAFSRKGEGRIDFKNRVIPGLSNACLVPGNTIYNTKFIYLDDENNALNKLSLADKKEAITIGDELKGFHVKFDFINEDAQKDLLTFGDGAVYGYDLFSAKLVESFNTQAVYEDAQAIATTNNNWIIAFDKAGQKIDVINKDGKVATSIEGSMHKPFISKLYKNGKTYILLIHGKKVSCRELN